MDDNYRSVMSDFHHLRWDPITPKLNHELNSLSLDLMPDCFFFAGLMLQPFVKMSCKLDAVYQDGAAHNLFYQPLFFLDY